MNSYYERLHILQGGCDVNKVFAFFKGAELVECLGDNKFNL